jgi:hypothetical protein
MNLRRFAISLVLLSGALTTGAPAVAQTQAVGGQPLPPRADPRPLDKQEPLPPKADPGPLRRQEPLPRPADPGLFTYREAPSQKPAWSPDELLSGLTAAIVNAGVFTVRDVIDVQQTTRLDRDQIAAILKALDANARAQAAAEDLTHELRVRGVLTTAQRVIGIRGGKLYVWTNIAR